MTNLTQCPNCTSIFAISDQQYSASNGNVRCGSCREKFNVVFLPNSDNLVLNRTILSNQTSSEDNSPPHRQIELLRILSEHAQQEELEHIDELPTAAYLETSIDEDLDAEANLDHENPKDPSEDLFANSFSESISTPSELDYSNFEVDHSLHTLTLHDDDLLSDELLDEVDALIEHKLIGEEFQPDEEFQTDEELQPDVEFQSNEEFQPDEELQPDVEFKPNEEFQPNKELHTTEGDYLPDEEFTLKASWFSRAKTAFASIALIFICLVLLSGLTYQLWLKQVLPESLIKPLSTVVPVIQPLTEKITNRYDLTLPVRSDLNNLQLVSAHTEAHPSRASTILLRVSFLNKAKIEQPLPDLELSLTNEDGGVVSRRTFAPIDYLYNNSTQNIISSNELKKVTIELLAFPKQAHGYELIIVD